MTKEADFNIIKFIIIGLILGILSYTKLSAQDIFPFNQIYTTKSTTYSINKEGFKKYSGYHFPPGWRDEAEIDYGFDVIKKKRITLKNIDLGNKVNSFYKIFDHPIPISFDSLTSLCIRAYTTGINSYTIYLFSDKDSCWYEKTYKLHWDGYQIPVHEYLFNWSLSEENTQINGAEYPNSILDNQNKFNSIDKLLITIQPKTNKFQFIIGELRIENLETKKTPVIHPIFDSLTQSNSLSNLNNNSLTDSNNTILLSTFNYYNNNLLDNIFIEADTTKIRNKDIIYSFFHNAFKAYPFYNNKEIRKDEILSKLERVKDENIDIILQTIKENVRLLKDPHFFFKEEKRSKKERTFDPIRLYEINDELFVSAVFDTTILAKINVGDKILRFDNTKIYDVCNNRSDNFKGTTSLRHAKAVSNIFKGKNGDKHFVTVIDKNNDTTQHCIIYNKNNIFIPPNFIPKHCDFKILKNEIAYFRPNILFPDSYIRLINHCEEIQEAQGLVIDLRNVGGGSNETVIRLLSLFITKPIVLGHYEVSNLPHSKETLVITPNKHFHIQKPITILINKATACACEIFCHSMRSYCDAVIIGDSKTAGTYSQRIKVTFPNQISVYTNVFGVDMLPDNSIIEGKGVEPDIWVWKNKIEDLYPYKDKILGTAMKYLNSHSNVKLK